MIGTCGVLSGCGAVPLAAAIGSYAADGGLIVTTGKSSTDHLVSMNTNRDCGAWRSLTKGGPLCRDRSDGDPNPYNIDYAAPFRTQTDSGLEVVRSGRDDGKLLTGDEARRSLADHRPDFNAPPIPTTAAASVPGEARFGSAGQPAAAPTPEGADVAAAGSPVRGRR
ncbi:MAG: hypothetical protein KF889_17020 [Alphaproteobacteria bacterium]|nr:hypothetical protein [Alphaproteobacteria bacterium]MCW5739927.1 hypothetical protein [Alphaproteobacteria bacterium]